MPRLRRIASARSCGKSKSTRLRSGDISYRRKTTSTELSTRSTFGDRLREALILMKCSGRVAKVALVRQNIAKLKTGPSRMESRLQSKRNEPSLKSCKRKRGKFQHQASTIAGSGPRSQVLQSRMPRRRAFYKRYQTKRSRFQVQTNTTRAEAWPRRSENEASTGSLQITICQKNQKKRYRPQLQPRS